MSDLEVLKAARELIKDPARWTQDSYARDVDGKITDPLNPDAVCWCAVGAIMKIKGSVIIQCPQGPLAEYTNGTSLIIFNDNHTHAEVMRLFDRQIADTEGGSYGRR